MSIDMKKDDWLIRVSGPDVGPGGYVHLYPRNGLSVAEVRAAVDAQYGKGRFALYDHGTVIYGYDLDKQMQERRRRAEMGK